MFIADMSVHIGQPMLIDVNLFIEGNGLNPDEFALECSICHKTRIVEDSVMYRLNGDIEEMHARIHSNIPS